MGNRIHTLAQQLTGKATLEECGLDELQIITQRYPYFAPAQFLLLQKLRQMGSEDEAEKQYRKAVLFYHDPLLFEHFISSNRFYVDEIMTDISVQEVTPSHDIHPLEKIEEGSFSVTGDPKDIEGVFEKDTFIEQPAPVQQPEDIPQDEATIENRPYYNSEMEDSKARQEKELTVDDIEKANLYINNQSTLLIDKEANERQPESELSFEPYHTVDYFASQGIKITQEEIPKDKLGKQLKSFTEWLKTMKRLPAAQITDSLENLVESKVESLASHSVTESDVVTEAMAEVWAKQGNTGKALDIYNKLSLINPSKKAYFAAKIENLKQS